MSKKSKESTGSKAVPNFKEKAKVAIKKTMKVTGAIGFFILLLTIGILIGFAFVGCAGLAGQNPLASSPQSQGFLAGAASAKGVDAIKDWAKTKYQLVYPSQEICTFDPIHVNYIEEQALTPEYLQNPEERKTLQDWFIEKDVTLTCFLVPCKNGEMCERTEPFAVFLARNNGKFSSLEISAGVLSSLNAFCKRSREHEVGCVEMFSSYGEESILLEIP